MSQNLAEIYSGPRVGIRSQSPPPQAAARGPGEGAAPGPLRAAPRSSETSAHKPNVSDARLERSALGRPIFDFLKTQRSFERIPEDEKKDEHSYRLAEENQPSLSQGAELPLTALAFMSGGNRVFQALSCGSSKSMALSHTPAHLDENGKREI